MCLLPVVCFLVASAQRYERTRPDSGRIRPTLAFVHIPKTGGSWLGVCLERCQPSVRHNSCLNESSSHACRSHSMAGSRHALRFNTPLHVLTIVRDPVESFASEVVWNVLGSDVISGEIMQYIHPRDQLTHRSSHVLRAGVDGPTLIAAVDRALGVDIATGRTAYHWLDLRLRKRLPDVSPDLHTVILCTETLPLSAPAVLASMGYSCPVFNSNVPMINVNHYAAPYLTLRQDQMREIRRQRYIQNAIFTEFCSGWRLGGKQRLVGLMCDG